MEQRNPKSRDFDKKAIAEILRIMNGKDESVAEAVRRGLESD